MTITKIELALEGINTRTYATQVVKELGLDNQAELMVQIAEIVEGLEVENADVMATFLMLKANQLLPKAPTATTGKVTKAQRETAEKYANYADTFKELADEVQGCYFDSKGIAHLTEATTGEAPRLAKILVEEGFLVEIGTQKFADGKRRKGYILATDTTKAKEGEIVAYLYK